MQINIHAFDLKGDGIYLNAHAFDFMLKYKIEIEKLNYYAWAKFLEIGDMLRVNFYRHSYKQNGDKSGDKIEKRR